MVDNLFFLCMGTILLLSKDFLRLATDGQAFRGVLMPRYCAISSAVLDA
jgi:hypothetical protein